ncbi:hypothetical protein L210DRAFT_3199653 [Boletus edulis BED1]|uniref:Uncharacterized protein n=1 Tax=Boletus edulis BED1 TaxID=1328754 RepID=A0AAD4BXA3_BOLED|nr:hypothetical protein L210DRAFT_3199653 [Boletus edulis BED1]
MPLVTHWTDVVTAPRHRSSMTNMEPHLTSEGTVIPTLASHGSTSDAFDSGVGAFLSWVRFDRPRQSPSTRRRRRATSHTAPRGHHSRLMRIGRRGGGATSLALHWTVLDALPRVLRVRDDPHRDVSSDDIHDLIPSIGLEIRMRCMGTACRRSVTRRRVGYLLDGYEARRGVFGCIARSLKRLQIGRFVCFDHERRGMALLSKNGTICVGETTF